MNTRIPLSSPSITNSERSAVLAVLETNTLSIGPCLSSFESEFKSFTRSTSAVAVNSGTSALHLAARSLGIGPGDEVITTPFSFVSSANCCLFEGAKPVFVDIDARTYNIDVSRIPAAVSRRTRAILPVHVFGRPCDMPAVVDAAAPKRLNVIEDACEAIGARINDRHVGTFGDIGVFAFYPNKQITTGEGGMVVTNRDDIGRFARSARNQGRGEGAAWLSHEQLGYNYRLSEMNCALGVAQMKRLPLILRKRAAAAELYTGLLSDSMPEVIPPASADPGTEISWFVYVVRLADDFSRSDRDSILQHLHASGIGCSNYFSPIHLQPFYRDQFGFAPGDFPITEFVAERTIALPFFTDIGVDQIVEVCRTLKQVMKSVVRDRRTAVVVGA